MQHPATVISKYYRKNNIMPSQQIECMEYTITTLLNELSKFLMYMIFFGVVGYLQEYLFCYISFVSLRLFAGGIHCKTYWRCFFLTFIFIGGCVFFTVLFPVSLAGLSITAGISCVFPMLLSPVTPSFRMIKNENHKLILRVFAILISCIWISAANYCGLSYSVASAVLCAISIANYQLIVPVMTSLFLNNSKRREEE